MKLRFFSVFDYFLFFTVLILITIGVLFIYSSGINSSGVLVSNEYIKQIIFGASGIVIMISMALFDYRKFKTIAGYLYVFLILVLCYTLFMGRFVNGARSWLGIGEFGVQPSEFGKIIFIIFFAWYLSTTEKTEEKKRFIVAVCILCLPMGLILLQPDLGTASVYIPIFLVMCFVAGIPLRYILMVFFGGCLTILITVLPIWESYIFKHSIPFFQIFSNTQLKLILIAAFASVTLLATVAYVIFKSNYYFWIAYAFGIITFSFLASIGAGKVLKPYQIQRLIVFLDPNTDPLGAGWNIIQSKIAIGSGNLWGQGFLKGTQSHYRFLPQQSTDFIFSILSEEWGFVGSFIVFILFFILLFRGYFILKNTTNTFGYYITAGILFMIFFHFIVNVGMVMGIMPITGIPLLFLSYGGSSLWTAMSGIGLLMSINYRRIDF